MLPRTANFVFLLEMEFLHVGKPGLELLTSGNPPALASQTAGITGMSYHAWPDYVLKCEKDMRFGRGWGQNDMVWLCVPTQISS